MTATVNRENSRSFNGPHFRRIEQDLRTQVKSGRWPRNTLIPSRKMLASHYGVSLATLERAVAVLLDDGTLRADSSRGTFVADRPQDHSVADGYSVTGMDRITAQSLSSIAATIGVVARTWTGDYLPLSNRLDWPADIVHALERVLATETDVRIRYKHVLGIAENSVDSFPRGIRSLLDEGVDAIAVVWPHEQDLDGISKMTDTDSVPVVLVTEGHLQMPQFLHVFHDLQEGGYRAATHLVQRGYKSMTFFSPFAESWWSERRLAGIRNGLSGSNCQLEVFQPNNAPPPEDARQQRIAYEAARLLLEGPQEGWSIVAVNDHAAIGFVEAANELGMVPGLDFGLVGFDDLPLCRHMGLTSLHPPLDAMGEQAANLLLRYLNKDRSTTHICLRSHLMPRDSSRQYGAERIPTHFGGLNDGKNGPE